MSRPKVKFTKKQLRALNDKWEKELGEKTRLSNLLLEFVKRNGLSEAFQDFEEEENKAMAKLMEVTLVRVGNVLCSRPFSCSSLDDILAKEGSPK